MKNELRACRCACAAGGEGGRKEKKEDFEWDLWERKKGQQNNGELSKC